MARRHMPWRRKVAKSTGTPIRFLVSLVYWVFRRLLELVALRLRAERSKELEILVLRHQLHVLQRQVARRRLREGCQNS